MLENFTVFSRVGVVLFSHEFVPKLSGNPLNKMIKTVLLQEQNVNKVKIGNYNMEWMVDNNTELIFIAVYQKSLVVKYVDILLNFVKNDFLKKFFEGKDKNKDIEYIMDTNFQELYDERFLKIQKKIEQEKKNVSAEKKKPRSFAETKRGKEVLSDKRNNDANKKKKNKKKKKKNNNTDTETETNDDSSLTNSSDDNKYETNEDGIIDISKIKDQAEKKKAIKKNAKRMNKLNSKKNKKPVTTITTSKKSDRQHWNTKEEFDESQLIANEDEGKGNINRPRVEIDFNKINLEDNDDSEEEEDDDIDLSDNNNNNNNKKKNGGFWSKIGLGIVSNRTITEESIESTIESFKEHLVSKNVASEIAEEICENIAQNLIGVTVNSFQSIKSKVTEALTESLTRILTPKKVRNILHEVNIKNKKKRPYTIVFVGVNGVGKSTSLSKVCAWLMQNNKECLIAACDTYRSGAIEQLNTHCNNLDVPLFEQGYDKDASLVASNAIRKATEDNFDVVLIDTAGRMQDNEPLMRSLSKLVNVNNPDLVLFVGEALVGNDGVDQLVKFNGALKELGPVITNQPNARLIDGIMLTKCDTIDDKIGAALSMVYSTSIPIFFVGVGQHYTDIKKMNVNTIIKALMK
eukprot:TRINITY_DN7087_c0_g1_i1.p1 TRINITY_DN7087_c0_g1~~TRINITY_DN7087_c0_g1_i1.p1  ORF type:complete len:632 (+),score=226.68 TRINITY_DN7087_c0_g1_i1:126-2021(+)